MNTTETAWTANPETPEEKLVLLALARNTYRAPYENLAIIGIRALRKTACVTPGELDMILTSLEHQGYITPDESDHVGRYLDKLNKENPQDGPWKAWHLTINSKETEQ